MKLKSIKLVFLLLLVVGIQSCQKESPMDTQGAVQFIFAGSIGSNQVRFEAGNNGYFLNTNYFDNGPNQVLLMRGEFINKADSTADFLRFDFLGYDSVSNANILGNVFSQTNYFSYSVDSASVSSGSNVIKFKSIFPSGSTHFWNFGDGTTGTGDSVTHTYAPNLGMVNVTMVSNNLFQGCIDSITNTLNLANIQNAQVQFGITANAAFDSFAFAATPGFTSYNWDFGNGQTGVGINAQTMYFDSLQHLVQLTATNPTSTSTWKGILQAIPQPCLATFLFSVVSTPSTSSTIRAPYKTCIITYRRNGILYSSFKANSTDQSNRQVFTLSSVEPYDNNASGQPTISLKGSVNTFLFNTNNPSDSISIVSSNTSIAVAHP